ncbi:anhydro-N-acetylmuramic acid kinase [Mucilaginibacter polytrichastri]|uniref:Anhydro-N-acetylmuramic acid kinase n=1 Tax=Mucilaginibacter polytrichastri TaxID=1302689 RepID=A0A1Q5ZT24_9SPHI|nr:anhydro-N-acetylmuramic acid kinase [Mucilaginibacter polytrichastri]OKS84828.1 Anhydro-N-acetylmuramic acid kinase [Mucilaginibacter polytrichastri]SFS48935.1 anhydro-N-acetylmuramic acid kinase [Mucilaginibacter polytrichastri]
MNQNIENLYRIAGKPVRTIIGLMSGTSFDGLDIALCHFSSSGTDTQVKVLHFTTKEYDAEFKEALKSVFAKRNADLERITLLNAYIGTYYAQLILQCLEEWNVPVSEVDIIASHGQTIFHAPKHAHQNDKYGNATLQIGDADHIAVKTGIITLSDFRQKHIAAGGEGAPLALYGDYLLFGSPTENRIMLNIGGIANFTYLPAGYAPGCFSTDVGPGNTLMDQFIQLKFPGKYYDNNAEVAIAGTVNEALLTALLSHPFFQAPFPKTTGPELFNLVYLYEAIKVSRQEDITNEDVMATLANFSAQAIISAISSAVPATDSFEIYMSGGGMYNPLLVSYIEAYLGRPVKSTIDLGIHPDAKEAVLFALLANEALAGGKTNYGGGLLSVSMGKVSLPK